MGQMGNGLRETKLSQTLQMLLSCRIKASICKRQDPQLKIQNKNRMKHKYILLLYWHEKLWYTSFLVLIKQTESKTTATKYDYGCIFISHETQ